MKRSHADTLIAIRAQLVEQDRAFAAAKARLEDVTDVPIEIDPQLFVEEELPTIPCMRAPAGVRA